MKEVTKEVPTTVEYLEMFLSELPEIQKIQLWNNYVEEFGEEHRHIYVNDAETQDKVFETPSIALHMTQYTKYDINAMYFSYSVAFGAESFDFLTDENCPLDMDELIGWLLGNTALCLLINQLLNK